MLILPAHILDSKGNEVEQSPSLKIEEMDSANVSNTHTVVLVHAVFMIVSNFSYPKAKYHSWPG